MKILVVFGCCFFSLSLSAQSQINSRSQKTADKNGDRLAQYMAEKMKDSLRLTQQQAKSIYDINMKIHEQKMNARRLNKRMDLLTREIQKIENTRDSLYLKIISAGNLERYKEKKSKIVSAS